MKLLLTGLLILGSFSTFAKTYGELDEVNCSVPALKSKHEQVKSEMNEMMIQMKVETMKKLGSLLLEFDANDIIINKQESSFFNNYASEISGNVTLKDGTVIKINGQIQYGQATFHKKYDRFGNYLGKYCGFSAFSNVNLYNSNTGRLFTGLKSLSVKLDLLKR